MQNIHTDLHDGSLSRALASDIQRVVIERDRDIHCHYHTANSDTCNGMDGRHMKCEQANNRLLNGPAPGDCLRWNKGNTNRCKGVKGYNEEDYKYCIPGLNCRQCIYGLV